MLHQQSNRGILFEAFFFKKYDNFEMRFYTESDWNHEVDLTKEVATLQHCLKLEIRLICQSHCTK